MSEFDIFPIQGESITGLSLWFQKLLIGLGGCGVLQGMELARNSASEIVVSSGYYAYYGEANVYEASIISEITAAASGKHRYDVVILNCLTGNIALLAGSEAVPDSSSNFLENYTPLPAVITEPYYIVLGILWIDDTGIKDATKGTYCAHGIASMRSPTPLAVDGSTILISPEGIISSVATAGGDLKSDGTVALSANWDVGAFDIHALTFTSDQATGSAPLIISSTTVVTNLNADLVDGIHGTALAKLDGTTPLTANWDVGSFQLRAQTLYADVATGTAPLTISSTTLVTNLNSDLLDGLEASAFLLKNATVALTSDWDAGNYDIRCKALYADVAIGTAPLTIVSTTVVTNLNSDLLDGLHSTSFPIIYGPYRITHDGGASQALLTTPSFCIIKSIAVNCVQASSTATVNLGWSGYTTTLMTNVEVPKTLNGKKVILTPTNEFTSATALIATVGGADSVGEWDVYLEIVRYIA